MKKGFTLIELLAVIVILAIIALIVTPVVSNIINSARKAANARSVEGHIKNVEYAIIEKAFADGTGNMSIYDDGDISDLDLPSSDNITCDSYVIENGIVKEATGCTDNVSKWSDKYSYQEGKGASSTGVNDGKTNTIVYRLSSDLLFIGDKIDLENHTITNYTKFNGFVDLDFTSVETNETHDMTGVYTTDLEDLLVENKNVYLKNTINGDGIIKKMEVCYIDEWGTYCKDDEHYTYGVDEADAIDAANEKTVQKLHDFFKWNITDGTSEYGETVGCGIGYSYLDMRYIRSKFPNNRCSNYDGEWRKGEIIIDTYGNVLIYASIDREAQSSYYCEIVNGLSLCEET